MYDTGSGCDPPLIVSIPLTVCSKFDVSLMFGSGVISLSKLKFQHSYVQKFYVLLDDAPCCFSEATLSKCLAALESTKTLHATHPIFVVVAACLGHWEMSLNVNRRVTSSLICQCMDFTIF